MLSCFTKEASYHAPTSSFLSVYISLCLSPVHRQAVSAEAGIMSTPTNPEVKELSPVDFIQLQQYIECEYRQGGGRAGGQAAFSALNTPPPPLPLPPTHTLIYTRSWFLISRGASSVPQCFSQACTSFVFLRLIYIHHVMTCERVWGEWNGDMEQYVRSARLSPCNLCVSAYRLQPEGKGRPEGIWCRWQSGSAQTRRGEGTEWPARHHQVHRRPLGT